MIKIVKSTLMQDIPKSIRPPFRINFMPRRIDRAAILTNTRRIQLIRKGSYIDLRHYNSRYKKRDIKKALQDIYHDKCAYCEQKVEQSHVEHYRPKQIYYWLAYSWDNLLCACHYCNEYKGTNFRIVGIRAALNMNLAVYKNFNTLAPIYNLSELPDLVNPETTDPTGQLIFSKDGKISSNNPRFQYTINTCRIDRTYLRDNRKKIFDDFISSLKEEIAIARTTIEQSIAIDTLTRNYVRELNNNKNEFLAFRKYFFDNWLSDEIKSLTQ